MFPQILQGGKYVYLIRKISFMGNLNHFFLGKEYHSWGIYPGELLPQYYRTNRKRLIFWVLSCLRQCCKYSYILSDRSLEMLWAITIHQLNMETLLRHVFSVFISYEAKPIGVCLQHKVAVIFLCFIYFTSYIKTSEKHSNKGKTWWNFRCTHTSRSGQR